MKTFSLLFALLLTACGGGYNEQGVPDRCAYIAAEVQVSGVPPDCKNLYMR